MDIIKISSDSERECVAEQKNDKKMWKFINPKEVTCKYNPDETK